MRPAKVVASASFVALKIRPVAPAITVSFRNPPPLRDTTAGLAITTIAVVGVFSIPKARANASISRTNPIVTGTRPNSVKCVLDRTCKMRLPNCVMPFAMMHVGEHVPCPSVVTTVVPIVIIVANARAIWKIARNPSNSVNCARTNARKNTKKEKKQVPEVMNCKWPRVVAAGVATLHKNYDVYLDGLFVGLDRQGWNENEI